MKCYRTGTTDYGLGKSSKCVMLGDASVKAMVERARLAEAVGYDTVWLADERFYREVYACLATLKEAGEYSARVISPGRPGSLGVIASSKSLHRHRSRRHDCRQQAI